MSVCSTVGDSAAGSANQSVYVSQFRRHVHRLILLGYRRLGAASYRDSQEPDITGELVRAMREITESPDPPRGLSRMTVHDDPPVNVAGRYGKSRQRVDIEFERTERGPHPRMQFEAKRLRSNDSVGDYVGREGLGCFLDGRYAGVHREAGMLGYVQDGDESDWAARISARLSGCATRYGLRSDGLWKQEAVIRDLRHTYMTRHDRQSPMPRIEIRHILLRFS